MSLIENTHNKRVPKTRLQLSRNSLPLQASTCHVQRFLIFHQCREGLGGGYAHTRCRAKRVKHYSTKINQNQTWTAVLEKLMNGRFACRPSDNRSVNKLTGYELQGQDSSPHIETAPGPHSQSYSSPHIETGSGPHSQSYSSPHIETGPGPHSQSYSSPYI
jgi:hypothetical protein